MKRYIKQTGGTLMALDGIVIASLVKELSEKLTDGRISKIAQPEKDALLLTIKNNRTNYRLMISAGASLPLTYLTDTNKPSPITAPNFCMLLRKHIANGKILSITQPGLERILRFEIEHLNELGDLCKKTLVIELMGKHSNIIFLSPEGMILDSIKHISAWTSSVREVLPGREYFIPETTQKGNPLHTTEEEFRTLIGSKPEPLAKAIYMSYTGISPVTAEEICFRSGLESAQSARSFSPDELLHLYRQFSFLMEDVKEGNFSPCIIYEEEDVPREFSAFPLTMYGDMKSVSYDSVSSLLEEYYASKEAVTRIRQKSSDLRRIVTTALDRNRKKYQLQLKQLKDTEKREQYRIYGELIHTYGYQLSGEEKVLECENYYTQETVKIPLDPTKNAQENASRYFEKYNKMKRTYEALSVLITATETEILHLESVLTSLDIAVKDTDLTQIKEELTECGYIRRKSGSKREKILSKPFHYLSSDGYHIYVGKNNYQNEELTFKVANGNDWWFHAKNCPGSHVIVKREDNSELPDRVFEEAGALAAWYSKNRNAPKVEIDYIQRKHVKKTPGGAPGFVIYHTNYSLTATTDISSLTLLSD